MLYASHRIKKKGKLAKRYINAYASHRIKKKTREALHKCSMLRIALKTRVGLQKCFASHRIKKCP
jgi:hypothetical protein